MRVRKIAKQLKLFHKHVTFDNDGYPVCKYKVANHSAKTNYIMRMTRNIISACVTNIQLVR